MYAAGFTQQSSQIDKRVELIAPSGEFYNFTSSILAL